MCQDYETMEHNSPCNFAGALVCVLAVIDTVRTCVPMTNSAPLINNGHISAMQICKLMKRGHTNLQYNLYMVLKSEHLIEN